SGRVFNPATKAYVRNAEVRVQGTNLLTYSEDGGYYRLVGVPAGQVSGSVTYTGSEPAAAQGKVWAGQSAPPDFELQPAQVGRGSGAGGDVVALGAFVVASEREGQAKAIMERIAAPNAKNVVASDNYGDLTMGDVGEFMKSMPGISLDYVEV